MESRYALRELEGVIGRDSGRLDDGRRALFRHTAFHRRLKRDFFERRDAIDVARVSFLSVSAMFSNPRVSLRDASDAIGDLRMKMLRTVFPYMDFKDVPKRVDEDDLDRYFDELEEIEAKKKAEASKSEESSEAAPKVGGGEGK